jgi:hypothetical protein
VELGLITNDGETYKMAALVVPFICHPLTSQPISDSSKLCYHLLDLELVDSALPTDTLEIDVLIGSDSYWDLVTGKIVKGENGPTAIQTRVGWVLSGPAGRQEIAVNLTFNSVHTLKVESCPNSTLDEQLKCFWDLESLGIINLRRNQFWTSSCNRYDLMARDMKFAYHGRSIYHPPLPDHLDLCKRRLSSLLKRLRRDPQLLAEYDAIIMEQLAKGIVEVVTEPSKSCDKVHYLPYHGVVRQDKSTSKVRVVYDASARSLGPSLNDCLYTGPKFAQSIFEILLRFRLQRVALAGDIEKAFLMISIHEKDRDSLRFLWVSDPKDESSSVITLRFTRVVFGVSSSPFLLNATVNHHIETFRESDPSFTDKFLSSIYVDDLVSGADDVKSTYEFYVKYKNTSLLRRIQFAKVCYKSPCTMSSYSKG